MNNVYTPAKTSKTQLGFSASYATDINYAVSQNLKRAQDESKKLSHETAIGSMYIKALTKYVIGAGLTPTASPENSILGWDDERLNAFTDKVESFYRIMTDKEIDWYGQDDFNKLQQVAFQNILISGDVLIHRCYAKKSKEYRPLLQLISGSWVANPEELDTKSCVGGVELDRYSVPIAYHIRQTDDNNFDTFTSRVVQRFNPVTKFEEFYLVKLFETEANQIRGIPYLRTVQNEIVDLQAFSTAHLNKAIVNSVFSIFITEEKDNTAEPNFISKVQELAYENANMQGKPYNDSDETFELGNGNMMQLEPGQVPTVVEPKLAGPDYAAYFNEKLDVIGGSTGIPREMALGSYNASFSASKGTIGAAEKGFDPIRQDFARKVCTPVYEQILDYGIRTGVIECPEYFESREKRKAVLAVSWIGPNPVVINPTAEVNAMKTAIDAGIISKEYATRSLYGLDFDEVLMRRTNERKKEQNSGLVEETNGRDAN